MDGPAGDPTNDPVLFPDDDEIDEFEAPLAANAENKALHKEVRYHITILEDMGGVRCIRLRYHWCC